MLVRSKCWRLPKYLFTKLLYVIGNHEKSAQIQYNVDFGKYYLVWTGQLHLYTVGTSKCNWRCSRARILQPSKIHSGFAKDASLRVRNSYYRALIKVRTSVIQTNGVSSLSEIILIHRSIKHKKTYLSGFLLSLEYQLRHSRLIKSFSSFDSFQYFSFSNVSTSLIFTHLPGSKSL